MFDVSDPKFWVTAAFILLIGLSAKKVSRLIAGVLDDRADKIKAELDAACALRLEAEEILALYKQKQAEFAKEAEEILSKARADAQLSSATAQAELKAVLDMRMKQAMEKIAQEEAAAVNEVRSHIVNLALKAARLLMVEQMSKVSDEETVRVMLSDIKHKIH